MAVHCPTPTPAGYCPTPPKHFIFRRVNGILIAKIPARDRRGMRGSGGVLRQTGAGNRVQRQETSDVGFTDRAVCGDVHVPRPTPARPIRPGFFFAGCAPEYISRGADNFSLTQGGALLSHPYTGTRADPVVLLSRKTSGNTATYAGSSFFSLSLLPAAS